MSDPAPGLDKTAIIVTTFLRDELLIRCVDSIRKFYPDVPVFVGDNGHATDAKREYLKRRKASYFHLDFDLGVSGVRNETLKLIPPEYEYLMIVEDDCVFTEQTRIEKLRDVLDSEPDAGLCGMTLILKTGKEQHYEARVHCERRVHYIKKVAAPEWLTTASGTRYTKYDLILNVFLMRRQVWLDNPWDAQFKTALEHCDFFMGLQTKTKWQVAYTPDVSLKHLPDAPGDYQKYRGRPVGWTLFGQKWGLDYVVSDYNAECPLSYAAMGAGQTVDIKGENLKLAVDVLNGLRVVWWLEAGTCLGVTREKGFIPHDPDIDIGIHPQDIGRADDLKRGMVEAGFEFYREWRHKNDLMELSFHRNGVKLDLFFFRAAGEFWWHGAFGPSPEGKWEGDVEFLPHTFPAYLFEHLAEVKLSEVTCYTPHPADQYCLMRYGPQWRFRNRSYIFWNDCRAIDRAFFKKKKTVFIGGVWDMLHVGHLNILERAKSIGSRLIVGVLTDEAAMAYKSEPLIPFAERKRLVEGLRIVDEVIEQHASDATEDLKARSLKPHYIIHGNDWNKCPGEEYVRRNGGKVVYFPYTEGISTTELRERLTLSRQPRRAAPKTDHVAVLIKTFLRDDVLFRTIDAVRAMMPFPYRLYIADDGRMTDRKEALYKSLVKEGHVTATLPFDSGISLGRNSLLKVLREDYVLLLDDDTFVKDAQSLKNMKACLDADSKLGIVAAVLRREMGQWFGPEAYSFGLKLDKRGDIIVRLPAKGQTLKAGEVSYRYADQVPNVFLAKREVFDLVRWDDRIKVEYEHLDFFLQLMKTPWKAGVCLDADAVHLISQPSPEYVRHRHHAPRDYFYSKHGIGNISNQF